jgi:deoxyadenosine/deoxycytidine kinase
MKIEETIRESHAKYIFLDRSLGTDKNVFEKMLYDSKQISDIEHNMYNLWCDFYYKYVRPEFENIVIYLRCDPQIAYSRIKKRGRSEEQNISLEYLNDLHKYHENWLMQKKDNRLNVIVVDCNKDFEFDKEYQNQVINQIVNQINQIKNNCKNMQNMCSIKNKIYVEENDKDIDCENNI